MKKIFYILSIALLGAVACERSEMPEENTDQQEGKVTLLMGIDCPELLQTRGTMAEQPDIDNIYVAVFGGNGYLNDYAKATPCDVNKNDLTSFDGIKNDELFYYKVTLTATSSQRYVHIIANGPDHLVFDYDYNLIPNLTTDAGEGAYWTMISLPNGTSYKDENGYDQPLKEAQDAFSNIKLIRNFAKVNVTSKAAEFELHGYKVFNTPDKGRIVTWKEDYQADNERLKGYFTTYVGEKDGAVPTFTDLQNTGYTPTLADGASIDLTAPTASPSEWEAGNINSPKFVFERERTNSLANRPYIILKGSYMGGEDTYYRLDFTDKDGNYIPIYRNFEYKIEISRVAKKGVSDPKDAQASNANVSSIASTASLTDLADGTSRILVQYLDNTFMESEEKEIPFQYLYMPDATKEIALANVTSATFKILTNEELAAIEGKLPNTDEPAFTPVSTATDWGTTWNSSDKWQEVKLKIAAQGTTEKRTTFRLTGETAEGDKLYRDVTIHVLPTQKFKASVTTSGPDIGATVTVTLTLEAGLPSSVFPLEVSFEDSNKRLNPMPIEKEKDNGETEWVIDMPAHVGPSIVEGNSNTSYQFVKSISYSDYNKNSYKISCEFKRISTGSTRLYMVNEYFEKGYFIDIPAN